MSTPDRTGSSCERHRRANAWLLAVTMACAAEAAGAESEARSDDPRGGRFHAGAGYLERLEEAYVTVGYAHPLAYELRLVPNVEYADLPGGEQWSVSVDAHKRFEGDGFVPWAGLGVGLIDREFGPGVDDTDLGLNLLFGADFPQSGRFEPFVRAKVVVADDSEFAVGFGVRLPPL